MASSAILRAATAAAFLAAAFLATACEHQHGPSSDEVDAYFYDCNDPKRPAGLTVFATDESLIEMLNKESAGAVMDKAMEAAALVTPASGTVLSAAAPPTFTITVVNTLTASPVTPALPRPSPSPRPRTLWQRLGSWLSPIGVAHAHCDPVSGNNFLLRLTSTTDNKRVYAALSSVTSFTPDAETWRKALEGRNGQTLRVTLLRAVYTGGVIRGGPFAGHPNMMFSVGP